MLDGQGRAPRPPLACDGRTPDQTALLIESGYVVEESSPSAFTVRAMVITADAESGIACLISVQTAEKGEPKPLPGSTALFVGWP
jgi:hypothetical protein